MYKDGTRRDVPPNAVVAVGYTLNTYPGNNGSYILSTNIQFVILLGIAK
jgi:hypothetical protein